MGCTACEISDYKMIGGYAIISDICNKGRLNDKIL